MTLDDEHMTAELDRRAALKEDRRRDWAERDHELRLRDEAESVEAEEAHWESTFILSSKHWAAMQHWDGT